MVDFVSPKKNFSGVNVPLEVTEFFSENNIKIKDVVGGGAKRVHIKDLWHS